MLRRVGLGVGMLALVSVAIASDMSSSVVGQITRSSPYVYVAHDGAVVAARRGMPLRIGDRIFTRRGGNAAYTVGGCDQRIGETSIATIVSAMNSGQPCIVSMQTFASAQDVAGLPGAASAPTTSAVSGGLPGAGASATGGIAGGTGGATAVAAGATAGAAGSGLSSVAMLFGGVAGAAASVAGATLGGGANGNESPAAASTPAPVANPVPPSGQTPSSTPDAVPVPVADPTPVSP